MRWKSWQETDAASLCTNTIRVVYVHVCTRMYVCTCWYTNMLYILCMGICVVYLRVCKSTKIECLEKRRTKSKNQREKERSWKRRRTIKQLFGTFVIVELINSILRKIPIDLGIKKQKRFFSTHSFTSAS